MLAIAFFVLLSQAVLIACTQREFKQTGAILPKAFGNFTHADLKSAPPCGAEMASFNGIGAYSNGEYQGTGTSCGDWSDTGLQWQCVEYTQRYFNYIYGTKPVWPVDYAMQMCDSYPYGMTTTWSPSVGDAVVFNWQPYGHTAVVTGIDGGIVYVIEQNGSPNGYNAYYASDVACYLTFYLWKEKDHKKLTAEEADKKL